MIWSDSFLQSEQEVKHFLRVDREPEIVGFF